MGVWCLMDYLLFARATTPLPTGRQAAYRQAGCLKGNCFAVTFSRSPASQATVYPQVFCNNK
jgi:hypothetical protein